MLRSRETLRIRKTKPKRISKARQQGTDEFVLVAFKCEQCCGTQIVRGNPHNWQKNLSCKCGSQIIVHEYRYARGKCKKCRTPFYNMIIANDLRSIRCRNCSSDIDLFVGCDGKFTA